MDLNPGRNAFVIPLSAGAPVALASFRVQLTPAQDTFYQNNELAAFSQIAGPPKVLLVAPPAGEEMGFNQGPRPDEYSALLAALGASGIAVEAVRPSALPSELPLLADYAGVILVDVPARDLSRARMEALRSYVRDLGGGLVAVGGPTSFGVGGYFRTPLEELLPVEMQIKDQQRRPRLTILFVIDKSGSMADSSGGVSKVDLTKEAAIRSVELLQPGDRVGVVAFDESAAWVVPITEASDPGPIINRIGSIRAGGGTDIMAGVQAVAKVLPGDDAQLKHVILLSDGGADPTGIAELVGRLHSEAGVTLSTVAVGSDAAPWLPTLAQAGAGRHHFAADPASIPSIFTEETTLATRSYIIEEPFFPEQAAPSAMLAGVEAVPQLLGYVGTSIKPAATEVLRSARKDPILATWQYGLGRAVAWTSDASGRWAQDWLAPDTFGNRGLAWPGFPRFWAQVVRSTLNQGLSPLAETSVEAHGERATVVVNAVGQEGQFLNGYSLRASVVSPDGKAASVDLRQVAPGRYEGDFRPEEQGAYLIRVGGADAGGGEPVGQTAGWVLSYSPEYRVLQPDPAALLRLAAATGGGPAAADPARAFAHDLPARRAARPVWTWTLLAAALLLPLDIAVRRLALSRYDFQRMARRVGEWIRLRRAARPTPERLPRLSALFAARDRFNVERSNIERSAAPPPTAGSAGGPVPLPTAGAAGAPTPAPAPPPGPASAAGTAPDSPAESPATTGAPAATAAALLAAKRARRSPGS